MAEAGYIKFHRSVEDSEDFVGMRPDQCWVAIRIAQLANYKPGFMRFRGQAIPVDRGELGHTLETIAKRTGASIKVVRTTIERCVRSGFLGTRTGMVAGTPYRILIVRNYDRFQGEDEEVGMVAGTTTGSNRARSGHVPGTDPAPRERRKEGEEGKKEAQASARVPNAVQEAWDREHPANAALLASLKAAGKPLTKSLRADVTIGIERATKELGVERAMRVVLDAYDRDPNPSIGWYASALHRASAAAATRETPKPSEPLPAPDPAFLDAHPGSREVWAEYEQTARSKATSDADLARLLKTSLFLFTNAYTEAA